MLNPKALFLDLAAFDPFFFFKSEGKGERITDQLPLVQAQTKPATQACALTGN